MNINNIENSIIERLKAKIPELHIEGFPEKPAEFKLVHPKGAILVHYQGGIYSDQKALAVIVQEKKYEFSITVVMRHLRTHEGAYGYLDRVRNILTGFKPEGGSKMIPVKDEFIGEDNGIWQYSINFTTVIPVLEDIEE